MKNNHVYAVVYESRYYGENDEVEKLFSTEEKAQNWIDKQKIMKECYVVRKMYIDEN